MDISRFQKLSNSKIESGRNIRAVRNDLKEYKEAKQDAYEGVSETFKPIIDVQKSIQKRNDEKQDELIDQLQRNQQVLTQVIDSNQKAIIYDTELPKAIEGIEGKETGLTILNIDNAFNRDDRIILKNNKLLPPKDLTQVNLNKLNEEREKAVDIAKTIGRNKRFASTEVRQSFDKELDTLRRYRKSIDDIKNSWQYRTQKGSGIYTQKKRNAYKIDQNGQYGGLIIDLPNLYGHLKVIAHKNGQKVYDKQADFDTLDLLTKRFNSKKKYSDLSKKIFDELNQISGIPIHRTSSKFKKMGQGVIYYNNPNDLLDRMELLGGSILAGNDGVKKEFIQIAHTLNKIGVINNNQLNDLLKEYII